MWTLEARRAFAFLIRRSHLYLPSRTAQTPSQPAKLSCTIGPRGLNSWRRLTMAERMRSGSQPATDMTGEDFRKYGYQVVDWIANYLDHVGELPVLARLAPGSIKDMQPDHAPQNGESMEQVLADIDRVILPGVTHWNHPAFFAYFAISGSAPGILGEMFAAALNVNAMMWRTSPAATELEEVTVSWLRKLIGLPDGFDGVIYDTASISTLVAIAAA